MRAPRNAMTATWAPRSLRERDNAIPASSWDERNSLNQKENAALRPVPAVSARPLTLALKANGLRRFWTFQADSLIVRRMRLLPFRLLGTQAKLQ
jgi:hypothetical protein